MKKLLLLLCLGVLWTAAPAQFQPFDDSNAHWKEGQGPQQAFDRSDNEFGLLENGLREGSWITRADDGQVIRMVNYRKGELHGSYSLFYANGKPKLMGTFHYGLPNGWWMYYNKRGRVVKQGGYADGKPNGVWEIYDKRGKKLIHLYDFGRQKRLNAQNSIRYFEKDVLMESDMSDVMIYANCEPVECQSSVQPLGGMALSNDFMLQHFIIPKAFMDTRTELYFAVSIEIKEGTVSILGVEQLDSRQEGDLSWLYRVDTELPKYVRHKNHREEDVAFLAQQIREYCQLMGPWVIDGFEGKLTMMVPFILNGGSEPMNLSMK